MTWNRPTAEEKEEFMASLSASTRGVECCKCGCRDTRVRKTKPDDGIIRRIRVCRNCGHRWATFEQ